MNEGMLLEAFNLAALWQVPVIFVCENNGYATTMPVASAVAGSITGRARAFGIPAFTVDGQDPEKVLAATTAAVARARAGKGPTFLECTTYRFDAHHTFEHRARLDLPLGRRDLGWAVAGSGGDPGRTADRRRAGSASTPRSRPCSTRRPGSRWAAPIPTRPPRSSTCTPSPEVLR